MVNMGYQSVAQNTYSMVMLFERAHPIEDPIKINVAAISNIFLPNISLNLVQTTRKAVELSVLFIIA